MKQIISFLVIVGLLAGCATSSTPSGQTQSPAQTKAASLSLSVANLKKGMSAEEVIALIGQPESRKPIQSLVTTRAEAWTYRVVVRVEEQQVPIATRDVPYIDPFTGVQRNIQESVFTLETVKTVELHVLVLLDGSLAEWKSYQDRQRTLL